MKIPVVALLANEASGMPRFNELDQNQGGSPSPHVTREDAAK